MHLFDVVMKRRWSGSAQRARLVGMMICVLATPALADECKCPPATADKSTCTTAAAALPAEYKCLLGTWNVARKSPSPDKKKDVADNFFPATLTLEDLQSNPKNSNSQVSSAVQKKDEKGCPTPVQQLRLTAASCRLDVAFLERQKSGYRLKMVNANGGQCNKLENHELLLECSAEHQLNGSLNYKKEDKTTGTVDVVLSRSK